MSRAVSPPPPKIGDFLHLLVASGGLEEHPQHTSPPQKNPWFSTISPRLGKVLATAQPMLWWRSACPKTPNKCCWIHFVLFIFLKYFFDLLYIVHFVYMMHLTIHICENILYANVMFLENLRCVASWRYEVQKNQSFNRRCFWINGKVEGTKNPEQKIWQKWCSAKDVCMFFWCKIEALSPHLEDGPTTWEVVR